MTKFLVLSTSNKTAERKKSQSSKWQTNSVPRKHFSCARLNSDKFRELSHRAQSSSKKTKKKKKKEPTVCQSRDFDTRSNGSSYVYFLFFFSFLFSFFFFFPLQSYTSVRIIDNWFTSPIALASNAKERADSLRNAAIRLIQTVGLMAELQ